MRTGTTAGRGRWRYLFLLFTIFILFSVVARTVLLFVARPNLEIHPWILTKIYAVGLFFDCVTFSYFVLPFAFFLIVFPDRLFNSRFSRIMGSIAFFIASYALLFDIVSEYTFFDEFGTRFNFIAVDYLVYTTEVVRNIRESYPVNALLGGIFVLNVIVFMLVRKQLFSAFNGTTTLRRRLKTGAIIVLLPLLSFAFVNLSYSHISPNNFADELAGNGIYNLFAAFRNNELDYSKFYVTRDAKPVMARLKGLVAEKDSRFTGGNADGITRTITHAGAEKRLNVIVIVEESMSAEYLGAFGNTKGLTPVMDRLAKESLFFTRFYAVGTRTVRGLEAVTLSTPPLPGRSMIKRPHNEGLFSWGSIMKERGYDTKFIYGGNGYFDNMNYFFANNGFTDVDEKTFSDKEITFSNAWGCCDEDIFRKVIREADSSYAAKKPFFSVVMTISNHRPYTYPDGRIDIPSKTGRDGSVKYADYAIGRLLADAGKKSWFNNTIFVIVADHCAGSARKMALPVKHYEIPLFIYSPSHIKPRRIDTLASQIDIAPTVLGLLNFSYRTRFVGADVLRDNPPHQRAFISTYQKLGYLTDDRLLVLGPKKAADLYRVTREDGNTVPIRMDDATLSDALAYYQGTNQLYKSGLDRLDSAVAARR